MSNLMNAQGKIFRIWEALLAACMAHAGQLPGIDSLKNTLQDILNEARQVKILQETSEGQKQGQTQQLATLIKKGDETARRLRSFAKAQLGTNNEFLGQFGVAPNRPRVRSAKKSEPAATTTPKAEA